MSVIATTFGGEVVWTYATLLEVAEGLAVIGLVLLFSSAAKSRGLGPLLDSPLLNKRLPSPYSYLFAFLGTLGVLSFVLLALCDMKRVCDVLDASGWDIVQYPLGILGRIDGSAYGPGGPTGYGALGLMTWVGTVVLLTLGAGFARALKLFAVPSLLFLTTVVLLFDPGDMGTHALNLVSGAAVDGVSLLSNWSLLTISLFFTLYALAGRARRGMRAGVEERSPSPGTRVDLKAEADLQREPGRIQKNTDD